MPPKIGVVILNWNNSEETVKCLEALRSVLSPQSCFEYFVVDNGSSDESLSVLCAQPDIKLIELGNNIGFAGGNNAGIRQALEAGCKYILLLNNDTQIKGDFISPLLSMFEKYPDAGIVSPKIYYADPPGVIWYAGGKFHQPRILGELIGMGEIDHGQYDFERCVDFAVGCCMLIRREVFAQIGLMDENFFFYHEDVDFSYRTTHSGFSIWYQPHSTLVHKVSSSTSTNLPQRTFLYARARMVFLFKYIRGFKIPYVICLEIVHTFRIVANEIIHGQTDVAYNYLRGLLVGLRDAYKIISTPKSDHANFHIDQRD